MMNKMERRNKKGKVKKTNWKLETFHSMKRKMKKIRKDIKEYEFKEIKGRRKKEKTI